MGFLRSISVAVGVFSAGTLFGAVFHDAVKNACYSVFRVLLLKNSKRNVKTVVLGLDLSGKTAVLYRLMLDTMVTTIPTIGFNVENIESEHVTFNTWDIGGQHKLRPLWRHYFEGTQALIYVIDSTDRARLSEAIAEFEKLLVENVLKDSLLLIFVNKQVVSY